MARGLSADDPTRTTPAEVFGGSTGPYSHAADERLGIEAAVARWAREPQHRPPRGPGTAHTRPYEGSSWPQTPLRMPVV